MDLLPFAVSALVATALGVVFVVVKFAPGLTASIQVVKAARWMRRRLKQSDEERRVMRRRQMFAEHVAGKIRDLDAREDWSDYRFAELEAEVEAVGRRRGSGRALGLQRGGAEDRRRERSLTKALSRSAERLILLQGDPGSGKSVSLRHLARDLAERARTSRDPRSRIPIYLNLKRLRSQGSPVDARLIETFVLATLAENATSDVDSFVEKHFREGMEDGTWVFLFDSFDEIPEVLSSTDVDAAVRDYSEAIFGFLHGINQCRGIVASRTFRAPVGANWPTFDILPLSSERRRTLIHRAGLSSEQEDMVVAEVLGGGSPVAAMSSNPMFLGLLCEFVRNTGGVPPSTHLVFEGYVAQRMRRDADRVQQRFGMDAEHVRRLAESLAFTMLWVEGLGLDPPRSQLMTGLAEAGMSAPQAIGRALDALVYMKLAQANDDLADSDPTFTFVHRRFTEYFATCVVLRDPQRVPPLRLLTDGNWRETAVTLLQTQEDGEKAVTEEAARLLRQMADIQADADGFWPPASHHILMILQVGFAGRREALPSSVLVPATSLVVEAFHRGRIHDRKSAVEVAGVVDDDALVPLLRGAFQGASAWTRDVAYRQTALLRRVPDDIAKEIRHAVLRTFGAGRLRSQRATTRAELLRLPQPEPFITLLRMLRVLAPLDAALVLISTAALIRPGEEPWRLLLWGGMLAILALLAVVSIRLLASGGGGASVWRTFSLNRQRKPPQQQAIATSSLVEFGLLVRFMVPLAVVPLLSDARLVGLAAMYLMVWGPVVLVYLEVTARPRPWLLPVAPFIVMAQALSSALRARRPIRWREFLTISASGVVLLATVWAMSRVAWPHWVTILSNAVFGVAILLIAGLLTVIGPLARARDRAALRRLDAEAGTSMTFERFLDLLAACKSEDGQVVLIADARRHRRIAQSPEAAAAVTMLIDVIQAQLDQRQATDSGPGRQPAPVTQDDDVPLAASIRLAVRSASGVAPVANARVLDELGRLAESLERGQSPVAVDGIALTAKS